MKSNVTDPIVKAVMTLIMLILVGALLWAGIYDVLEAQRLQRCRKFADRYGTLLSKQAFVDGCEFMADQQGAGK